MIVSVVGLGKIGLPLAVYLSSRASFVYGIDIDEEKVRLINKGEAPIAEEQDLLDNLSTAIHKKKLIATTKPDDSIKNSEVIIVVVPLYFDLKNAKPNFESLDDALAIVGKNINKGTLIIVETTLPVGTTRDRVAPLLERISGLKAGKDFYLSYSPERVFSGRIFEDLQNYPKIVGGINMISTKKAKEFYDNFLNSKLATIALESSDAAELSKLVETTYRDVNIALANEFALFAQKSGIDFYKVKDACNTQPFSHIHLPGISVGGHCIPVYPHLYMFKDRNATLVKTAREINERMPDLYLEILKSKLRKFSDISIAILGLSYREGVKEVYATGTFRLVELLRKEKNIRVLVNDPLYTNSELRKYGLEEYVIGQMVDVVILHTAHEKYVNLTDNDFPGCQIILDGRSFLPEENFSRIELLKIGKSAIFPRGN